MVTSTMTPKRHARAFDYRCMECGQSKDRDDLLVKKVVFLEMGVGGRTIRSRVRGWICTTCVESDPDWNREPWAESPGHVGTKIEKNSNGGDDAAGET